MNIDFVVSSADEVKQNVLASHRKCGFRVGNMGARAHTSDRFNGARLQSPVLTVGCRGVKMAPATAFLTSLSR